MKYNGTNFKEMTEDMIADITSGVKKPLMASEVGFLVNSMNPEYYRNHLMKNFWYAISLLAGVIVPLCCCYCCYKCCFIPYLWKTKEIILPRDKRPTTNKVDKLE